MKKIMKFENSDVQIARVQGVWMFELYSVGMALGQTKVSKGVAYPRKDRINENVKNAEIKPVVRNGQPYITEEQVYDLMLETRTDKCKQFRKWLTNEVLPTLRKTGTYQMEQNVYTYFDKMYKGVPVLSVLDVSHFTGVNVATIHYFMKHNALKNVDYHVIEGENLHIFKRANPLVEKNASSMCLISRSGFLKLCKTYCIAVDTPKCFETKSVQLTTKNEIKEYALPFENDRFQERIAKANENMMALKLLLTMVNRHNLEISEFNSLRETIAMLGVEICACSHHLRYEKIKTTNKLKIN